MLEANRDSLLEPARVAARAPGAGAREAAPSHWRGTLGAAGFEIVESGTPPVTVHLLATVRQSAARARQ
jgi:hypothetical protein